MAPKRAGLPTPGPLPRSAWFIVFYGLLLNSSHADEPARVAVSQIKVKGQATPRAEVEMIKPGEDAPRREILEIRNELLPGAILFVPSLTVIGLHSTAGNDISLAPGTQFRVNSVSAKGELYGVLTGEAVFNVRKALDFYQVDFKGFVALVRGTRFTIHFEPGRQADVDLSEGRLHVERQGDIQIQENGKTVAVSEIKVLEPRRSPHISFNLTQDEYLHRFGSFQEAEAFYRQRLAEATRAGDFDLLQAARNDLGSILITLGNASGALPLFEAGTQAAEARNDLPWLARMLNNLGGAKLSLRDFPGAIEALERALTINRQLYPNGIQKRAAHNYNNLGLAYGGLGNIPQAIEYFRQALAANAQLFPDGRSPAIAGNHGNLGAALLASGNAEEGFAHLRRAVAILEDLDPQRSNPELAKAYHALGVACFQAGDYAQAMHYHRLALNLRQSLFPGLDHPSIAESQYDYGRSLWENGLQGLGLKMLEASLAMQTRLHPDGRHPALALGYRRLAKAWRDLGNESKSVEFERRAEDIEARSGGNP